MDTVNEKLLQMFHPNLKLNRRELNHLVFYRTSIGKILADTSVGYDKLIKRVEMYMDGSASYERDVYTLFRNIRDDKLLRYFKERYPHDFQRYAATLSVPEILRHRYLSDPDKIDCIQSKNSQQMWEMAWKHCARFGQSAYVARHIMQHTDVDIPKNALQYLRDCGRPVKYAYLKALLGDRRVDPAPSLGWIFDNGVADAELLGLVFAHPLLDAPTVGAVLARFGDDFKARVTAMRVVCRAHRVRDAGVCRKITGYMCYIACKKNGIGKRYRQ